MLVVGSTLWAYIIGSACGIIATLDPARLEYRQTLDELNFFLRDMSIPSDLTVKLRSYFRNTMYLVRVKRYESLLAKMSTRLRGDTAFEMCRKRLRKVDYLVHDELEPEFMCSLAIKYATSVYSRLERVSCSNLFVVERGVVAKRGRLGLAGACFGIDVILSNNDLRDLGDAIALTFVQTISLTQQDIFELLPDYPRAYNIVRRAALRMALVRAVVKAAHVVRRGSFDPTGLSIADIFDKAMRETAEAIAQEAERKKPSKLGLIPLRLSRGVLALKQQQGAHTKGWQKLSHQRSNLQRVAAADTESGSFARRSCTRKQKHVLSAWSVKTAPEKLVRPPTFGQHLLEQNKQASQSTEGQFKVLLAEVTRSHTAIIQSTAQLLEGHAQLNSRMEKLEKAEGANAAVLAKLEQSLASLSRPRHRRHRTRSPQTMEAAASAATAGTPSCMNATLHGDERVELREEGAMPFSPGSPFSEEGRRAATPSTFEA